MGLGGAETSALVWLLGAAAAMTIAAVNSFGWLLVLILKLDRQQTQDRHADATRLALQLQENEHRCERRFERLETASIGFRRAMGNTTGE